MKSNIQRAASSLSGSEKQPCRLSLTGALLLATAAMALPACVVDDGSAPGDDIFLDDGEGFAEPELVAQLDLATGTTIRFELVGPGMLSIVESGLDGASALVTPELNRQGALAVWERFAEGQPAPATLLDALEVDQLIASELRREAELVGLDNAAGADDTVGAAAGDGDDSPSPMKLTESQQTWFRGEFCSLAEQQRGRERCQQRNASFLGGNSAAHQYEFDAVAMVGSGGSPATFETRWELCTITGWPLTRKCQWMPLTTQTIEPGRWASRWFRRTYGQRWRATLKINNGRSALMSLRTRWPKCEGCTWERLSHVRGDLDCEHGDASCNRCVFDVANSFERFKNAGGRKLSYKTPRWRLYPAGVSANAFLNLGGGDGKHFQSFVALPSAPGSKPTYVFAHGGETIGYLGVVTEGELTNIFKTPLSNHPGGMQAVGDYLVVAHDVLDG